LQNQVARDYTFHSTDSRGHGNCLVSLHQLAMQQRQPFHVRW